MLTIPETIKLFDSDAYATDFSATVLSAELIEKKKSSHWEIVLDRTLFFPEEGGQTPDTGTIEGYPVIDVQLDGNVIRHSVKAKKAEDGQPPFAPGQTVHGQIDFAHRFSNMQNHSGEHILSGLVHNAYGFNNVGFHMGAECMIIDFSGELTWEQLTELETRANEVVRQNIPLHIWFPDANELQSLEYRSKLELTENVRIVEIPGVDRCACCAPHVERTGEVGIVKILDSQRHRGGVRVSVVCGLDALEDYRARQESVTEISRALSAKRGEVTRAVQRVLNEQQSMKERRDALSLALIRYMAEAEPETAGNILVFDATLGEIAQRELVNRLMEKAGGFAAVFCGSNEDGWRYIVGSRCLDLRAMSREINAAIQGRGGGTPQMIQGSARADRAEIEAGLRALKA